jgi:hypothetical protein
MFWDCLPTKDDRSRLAAQVEAQGVRHEDFDHGAAWCSDEWWIGGAAGQGLLVEVSHMTADGAQASADAILRHGNVTEDLLSFAAALAGGRAVRDCPSVGRLRDRFAAYPIDIAETVVRRFGQIDHFWPGRCLSSAETWLAFRRTSQASRIGCAI